MTDGFYANGERIGKVVSVSVPSAIDDWVQEMYTNSSYITKDIAGDRFEYYDPSWAKGVTASAQEFSGSFTFTVTDEWNDLLNELFSPPPFEPKILNIKTSASRDVLLKMMPDTTARRDHHGMMWKEFGDYMIFDIESHPYGRRR